MYNQELIAEAGRQRQGAPGAGSAPHLVLRAAAVGAAPRGWAAGVTGCWLQSH